jgi:hypothetical protein
MLSFSVLITNGVIVIDSGRNFLRLDSNTKNYSTRVKQPQMTRLGLDLLISAVNDSTC